MTLLNYQDFLFETYGKVKLHAAKQNLLRSISNNYLNENEKAVFNYLITEGFTEDVFFLCESNDYELLLEESIFTKFKEKYEKAKELIKTKGKKAISDMSDATKKVINFGGNILKAVQVILKKVAQVLIDLFEKAKQIANEAVEKNSDKIKEKVKSLVKKGDKKVSLTDETSHIGGMTSAGAKFIKSGYLKNLSDASKTAATEDEGTNETTYISILHCSMLNEIASEINKGTSIHKIVESLNESEDSHESKGLNIPFLSSLMDKIGRMPPFSLFHKLGNQAAEFSNNMLSKASFYINKVADGPSPYKFVAYGAIVGVAVGYYTEHYAMHKVEHFMKIIPGYGTIEAIISGVGMALAVYGLVKALVGQEEEEGEVKTDKE